MGIILLAAGLSSRLGRPKQLLPYGDQSLLQHAVAEALAFKASLTVVVLGAHAELLQEEIHDPEVHVVVNKDWKEGMASSLRAGLAALQEINPAIEAFILLLCDQPFVTASLLNELQTAYQNTGKPIIACGYAGTFGPPTLFHKSIFEELLQLRGDVGARSVIMQHTNDVEVIRFPEGAVDVDTEADYQKLSQKQP